MHILKKVNFYFKSRGLAATILAILKGIGSRIGVNIKFTERQKTRDLNRARKIFKNRSLEYDERGFWHVNPMPDENKLNEYYSLAYWDSFNSRTFGVGLRDIRHYHLLLKLEPQFNDTPRKVLNFGAGHGGISVLLHLQGHDIVNVEPSDILELFPKNWVKRNSINDVCQDEFDLIYGCHSLEHVSNIEKTIESLSNLSNDKTIFFWEVPNARYKYCGVNENRIDIPHTYYFTEKFFQNIYPKVLYSKKYDTELEDSKPPHLDLEEVNGDALLFVGKN